MKGGRLTKKQKALADFLLENPKESATEAAMQTYDVVDRRSASVIAAYTMNQPHVQAYMVEHSQIASDTMFEIMDGAKKFAKGGGKEGAAYAGVAVSVAKDILDRVHGKATQKIETESKVVTINIDLSQGGEDETDEN
jgi:hypothetical protein